MSMIVPMAKAAALLGFGDEFVTGGGVPERGNAVGNSISSRHAGVRGNACRARRA